MAHIWAAEYDQHQSTHELVAYSAHEPDGGARPTVLIRRSDVALWDEPLRVTFTVTPGD